MLKTFLPTILTLLFTFHGFGNEEYSIHVAHSDWTSSRFEILIEGNSIGNVEKSALGVRTHYNLNNAWGTYASCTSRLLSWGTIRNCWKVFDVYDDGKYGFLGSIRGISSGDYAAKFEISDWSGTVYATADVDLKRGLVRVIQAGNPESEHLVFQAKCDDMGELYWSYIKKNRWFAIQTMNAFAAILADYFPPTNAYDPNCVIFNK